MGPVTVTVTGMTRMARTPTAGGLCVDAAETRDRASLARAGQHECRTGSGRPSHTIR